MSPLRGSPRRQKRPISSLFACTPATTRPSIASNCWTRLRAGCYPPIVAIRASDSVCQAIRTRIISREYPPGMRLTEEALASEFGISRVPIREALRVLVVEGFLDAKPNWGTFVVELNSDEAAHFLEIRAVLEPLAASRAALNRTPDQILAMRETIKEADIAIDSGDFVRTAELNGAFHELLAEASGNKALAHLVHTLRAKIHWVYAGDLSEDRVTDSWREHEELVEAIEAGNASRAETIVKLHVDRASDAYLFRTGATDDR